MFPLFCSSVLEYVVCCHEVMKWSADTYMWLSNVTGDPSAAWLLARDTETWGRPQELAMCYHPCPHARRCPLFVTVQVSHFPSECGRFGIPFPILCDLCTTWPRLCSRYCLHRNGARGGSEVADLAYHTQRCTNVTSYGQSDVPLCRRTR